MPLAEDALERELFRILDILREEGIRHFATGALARNLNGESRTSRDFDIVLDVERPSAERLRGIFEARGDVEVAYEVRSIPVIHPEDYVLRKLVNYYRVRGKAHDLEDAHQVLLYEWDHIDREALVRRATAYRIEKRARELIAIAEEDRRASTGEPPES